MQKSKVGGLLHTDSTIIRRGYTNNLVALIHLESVTSVRSSHSCYPRQRMNVFTPLKKQAIHYHLLILSMLPCEQSRDSVLCLNTFLSSVIFFTRFNISFFFCQFMFYGTIQNQCAFFSVYKVRESNYIYHLCLRTHNSVYR